MFRKRSPTAERTDELVDVVLVGGGIMSATLGAMLARLQPDWSIILYERLGEVAGESSNAWNNAGTGHSGLCELNYMPDPHDATKAADIARRFALSLEFWSSMISAGEYAECISPTPHLDVVFGARDVAYLRERFATLQTRSPFTAMQYTEDPETIAAWAPLLVEGRTSHEPMAATRYKDGTDVDFGALTRFLIETMNHARVRLGHEVAKLDRTVDGHWHVCGINRRTGDAFTVRSRFVFVGAGGYALKLLQKARIPEVRGYAVFPFGAQFLRTRNPDVVERHDSKVYSQAALGAPPMSVPHLDRRLVDGETSLMFGPYATFDTKLLRTGRRSDLFTTLRPRNVPVLLAAGVRNLSLVRYLVRQLVASRDRKFAELQRFYPEADFADWELVQAGQRAQLVKPDRRKIGVLTFGTELVIGGEGSIAGLLGASPGASTAPSIMLELLAKCFPDRIDGRATELRELVPGWEPANLGH